MSNTDGVVAAAADASTAADAGAEEQQLGDAGKQALDRMKADRQKARAEAAELRERLNTLEAERAGVDAKSIEQQLRTQIEQDANTRAAGMLRNAEVRAVAAELGFINPADAAALLPGPDLADIDVTPDGTVDTAGVRTLLEQLTASRPYLLKPTDSTADHRTAGIGGVGSAAKPEFSDPMQRLVYGFSQSKTQQ
jgi:hypothetical protein